MSTKIHQDGSLDDGGLEDGDGLSSPATEMADAIEEEEESEREII